MKKTMDPEETVDMIEHIRKFIPEGKCPDHMKEEASCTDIRITNRHRSPGSLGGKEAAFCLVS